VWACEVAHTSAVSGTFAADRAANPTYWSAVNQGIVVREEFAHGTDYFVGDFVFDTSEYLGGIVLAPFTGDTNLRNDIANIGIIFDLKDDLIQWPTSTTALGYLRRNAGNTAYETRTPDEAANDLGLPLNANVAALDYLRRNAGDTAYEARTPAQTRGDLALDFYESDLALDETEQGQARANIGADLLGGFRNKVINGDFDIWQRATSQTSSGYGSDDRWQNNNTGSTKTASRQTFTAGQTDVPGNPTYFSRTVVTSVAGAGNFACKIQPIENVRTVSGKKATVTFYAKADASKNIGINIRQYFGTGGSPSASVDTGCGLKALTTSWQKFSFVVDVPNISGKTLGTNNDHSLQLEVWFDAGSTFASRAQSVGQQSGTFDIAHVSIVEGDATAEDDPFSPRHIQQEEALCQRYLEKSYDLDAVPGVASGNGSLWAFGTTDSSAGIGVTVQFKTRKRTTPTMTYYRRTVANSPGTWDASNNGNNNISATATTGGIVGQTGALIYINTSFGTFVPCNICGHWVADAEL
jgi:hypothetical protein